MRGIFSLIQRVQHLGTVPLTSEQRGQVGQAADVLERLAGEDGIWNHDDVDRNVEQLKDSGNLGVRIVDLFSPNTLPDRFHHGLDKAGVKAGHQAPARSSPEGRKAGQKEISKAELEQFQSTMDMLQRRNAKSHLQVQFTNGVPVSLLKAMAEGRSVIPSLLESGATLRLKA